MSIWELPMLCPWCMKFAIIEICFKYATFPVVGPTPLPTLISIKSPSFIHVITLPHGVTVCFIKPTHDTYLANERWGEVSWRFWWARSNCYKVTYRHSSTKCCCISMWQQEPQQSFCHHEGVSQRQNQYAEGGREERSKQLLVLEGVRHY